MEKCVFTIARSYGSGGRTIGKMLAEKLGIPYYDREILYMASEESGISLELFGKNDETVKKSILDPFNKQYRGELIPPESDAFVSDKNLFNYQAKIITELYRKGSCVIIGRCADFILKEQPDVIRTFIWAPHDDCIKNVMDITLVDDKEAKRRIRKIDEHRSAYYRYYTGHRWDDVRNFDLCLNSSALGFEKTVDVISDYSKIRFD